METVASNQTFSKQDIENALISLIWGINKKETEKVDHEKSRKFETCVIETHYTKTALKYIYLLTKSAIKSLHYFTDKYLSIFLYKLIIILGEILFLLSNLLYNYIKKQK